MDGVRGWMVVLCCLPLGWGQSLDDYLTNVARGMWEKRAQEVAALRTPEQIRQRQTWARTRFIELLGGLPQKTPLNPRITGTLQRNGYRVEKLIFESQPKFYVTADLYVPAGKGPFPAVLGTAGHSETGKAQWNYQRAWIELARRGFVVIAFDPLGQGERLQYFDPELGTSRVGIGTAEHSMAGLQCLLTGSSLARYFVWDGIRALDYLLTRAEVDPRRIGVAGNSGGGTQAAYLAMVEPRLAVAAPSCFMTSSEKLWTDLGPQDAEQNVTGLLANGLGMADYALAFAPRPFLFLAATQDFFPIAGARATYQEASRIYSTLIEPDKVAFFEYNDTHGWSQPRREATYRWMERWLKERKDEGREGEFDVEPESALRATPTGQLATSLRGETVQSLNLALAEKLAGRRRDTARETILKRLAIPQPAGAPACQVVTDSGRMQNLALETEKGGWSQVRLSLPEKGPARKPAVVFLANSTDADVENLLRCGHIVLEMRPRGADANYQTLMRALLAGRTPLGFAVWDTLAAVRYLAGRDDVDAERISVFGKGTPAVAGLFAKALEPRIRKAVCQDALVSYMAMARARIHRDLEALVIPGVLRDFDLPDVAAAAGAVWIVNPRNPAGALAGLEAGRREYGKLPGAQVLERTEGWAFEKVFREWLAR